MRTDYRINLEARDDQRTIGVNADAEKDAPYIAHATSEWANDLTKEYGFVLVPKSKDGTPYNPKDGAAAFTRAIKRLFGTTANGISWGPMPPILEELRIQTLIYQAPDMRLLTEDDLFDRLVWTIQELVSYAQSLGIAVPSPYSENDRVRLVTAVLERCHVVRTEINTVMVPQGAVTLPGTEITFILGTESVKPYGDVFQLRAIGKKIDSKQIEEVKRAILEELDRRSIFKGRCMSTNGGDVQFWCPFQATRADELILTAETEERMRREVFAIFRNQDGARKKDHSLLRSKFLAAGAPGTGKTEWTNVVAQVALQYGITVVRHSPNDPLDVTQRLLGLHAPAIGIIEDIEVYMPDKNDPEYHAKRSDILERFDGGLAKGQEVMFLFTTNYPEMIDYAASRQGRVDGYFKFESLDAHGFEKLVQIKLGAYVDPAIDYAKVWELAGHMSSAFLAGIVKIANKYLLDYELEGREPLITQHDLELIVSGLRDQWEWHLRLGELAEGPGEPSFRQVHEEVVRSALEGAYLNDDRELVLVK